MSLKVHGMAILRAALKAADPVEAALRHASVHDGVLRVAGKRYRLDRYRNLYIVGAGKAGALMAKAMERLLGRRITEGVINVKDGHVTALKRIELVECGHPVPDERGVAGARRIAAIAAKAGADDLVICLISGGASALMPFPADPVTLDEKQQTTKLLLACGANIGEMNTVRKHISAIKGGQLARLATPATVICLQLSDVIGDDMGVIGSGPTTADSTTFADAAAILDQFELREKVPPAVLERIERGMAGEIAETPKPGDPSLSRVQNLVVGSNLLAVNAAAAKARGLGYRTIVLSTLIEGETREVARMHAAILKQITLSGQPLRRPACVISGGETTVTLRGSGLGGRNQEFALAAAPEIAGLQKVFVLSAGTDGTDGPTDAAGACSDGTTLERAGELGLDACKYLNNNDSYHFFELLGDLIKTGPTNTNVMDIRVMLAGAP